MKNQGRLAFEYEIAEKDSQVTALGGLPLVAEAMAAFGVMSSAKECIPLGEIARQFESPALVQAHVLLMAAGGDCLDDLKQLREDSALCELLGTKLPSPETARQFLYAFHDEQLVKAAPGKKARIPAESQMLQGLAEVITRHNAAFHARFPQTTVTLDIDGTIIESHKKEALPHYQGGRGYQPVVACWAETGLAVSDEFRDGNVPGHQRPLEYVTKAFAAVPSGIKRRYLRGDIALYSPLLHEWLVKEKIEFAIGAKMRTPLRKACELVKEENWELLETRSDTIVDIAEVAWHPRAHANNSHKLRYIAVRMRPRQGDLLDKPIKYLAIVTNRKLPPAKLAKWYWGKAGTVEKLHDIVKNELGAGVMPCGRFGANAAWYRLALLTNNILQTLKYAMPNEEIRSAKPKRLRFNVFNIPAIVVKHARKTMARLTNRAEAALAILRTRERLWIAPGLA